MADPLECTCVVGLASVDETFLRMLAVFDACLAAKVSLPPEVEEYFGGKYPQGSEHGRSVDISDYVVVQKECADDVTYYDVSVRFLPEAVHTVRFVYVRD